MWRTWNARVLVAAMAMSLMLSGCDDDDDLTGPAEQRVFDQIERLGNPLVSEVTIAKRNHGFHNSGNPGTDVADFRAQVEAFITGVGGRSPALASTISGVLLPDMLIVQTDRAPNTSGWLTWALADGYGGRNLTDDVVDAGLDAIFGDLLSPTGAIPALSSDNVPANDKPFSTAFPYLAEPTL